MYHFGLFTPFHLIGGIFNLLFWLVIILLVIRIARGSRGRMYWDEVWGGKDALNILRERYAKGEISKEEYEERKRVLESK